MSRKKRKAVKASAPPQAAAPSAESPGGKGAALLPLGAFLAMVVAWAGALGGVAAGNTDLRALFDVDTLHSWLVFRDAFLLEGYPASGWRHGVSLFYFPEYAVLWPLYAAGLDFRAAMIAMTLIYAATSAFGWALVCDSLYGKSPVRRAAVFLLHAAPFLILSWAHSDIYSLQLRVVFHYGAWTLVPWMLWLFIRALHNTPQGRAGKGGAGKDAASVWQNLFAAAVLLALVVASDLIVVPWFAAPALFSLMCLCVLKKMKWGDFFPFAAAVVFGIAAGLVLKEVPDFPPHRDTELFLSLNPSRTLSALSGMAYEFSRFAGRNPFSALMVCAFAAVALWRLSGLRKGGGRGAASEALKWMGVPDSRAHWFMALFVPVSAAASVAAVAATGNFIPVSYGEDDLAPSFRYFAPFFFLPLFSGWALLPFSSGAFRGRESARLFCARRWLRLPPRRGRFRRSLRSWILSPRRFISASPKTRGDWDGRGGFPPGFSHCRWRRIRRRRRSECCRSAFCGAARATRGCMLTGWFSTVIGSAGSFSLWWSTIIAGAPPPVRPRRRIRRALRMRGRIAFRAGKARFLWTTRRRGGRLAIRRRLWSARAWGFITTTRRCGLTFPRRTIRISRRRVGSFKIERR